MFYNHKPTAHRGYLFGDATPLYPFGFGLSYTTFEISAPRPARASIGPGESLRVDVDVANTGDRAGDEVVQLYLHDEAASVTRPVLELKRFRRVTLTPGARTTVSFELQPADLAIWDIHMKQVVEPGAFTLDAGPDSVRLKSASFTVTG
jgi:beta-glucosidase